MWQIFGAMTCFYDYTCLVYIHNIQYCEHIMYMKKAKLLYISKVCALISKYIIQGGVEHPFPLLCTVDVDDNQL